MGIYSFFRISKPSAETIPQGEVEKTYKRLRKRTFWGVAVAYSLFYLCRMTFSVVKQPLIDDGLLTASQLGIIGSAMFFVYAIGKFCNGFIADYCNMKRFMAVGLVVSSFINLLLGLLGIFNGLGFISSGILLLIFIFLWGVNGWMQSMGAPPTVICLSRWYPLSERATRFGMMCTTPHLGKFLSFIVMGALLTAMDWYWGFLIASVAGMVGSVVVLLFVSDTTESAGLPSIQELSSESTQPEDELPVKHLQASVLRHPGLWVVAMSSAFIYVTQYAVIGWGVLFLQKARGFSLVGSSGIIATHELAGVAGTLVAGWMSDRLFRGSRIKPLALCGLISALSLAAFLLVDAGPIMDLAFISVFSAAIAVVYCLVAGVISLDIVPRKISGAALGFVGVFSYMAVAVQDVVSGALIQPQADGYYDFVPVSVFWIGACVMSFILPLVFRKTLKVSVRR